MSHKDLLPIIRRQGPGLVRVPGTHWSQVDFISHHTNKWVEQTQLARIFRYLETMQIHHCNKVDNKSS